MALHARCKSAADNAELPFLYTPGVGEWTLTKTRRLQRLHGELLQLRRPFAWEGDPGASVFHQICLEVEREAGGTLPALVTRHVVEALQMASTPPFHLSEVQGIIVLNAAPDFSEIERDLLAAVASLTPVHQLLTPGSFRLGYHGAYLVDQAPCTDQTLPTWLPPHNPWVSADDQWRTDAGVRRGTVHTRLTLDERSHSVPAALALIQAYRAEHNGRILVVDAGVQERPETWSNALSSIGMSWSPGSSSLNQQPTHQAVLRAARLAQGCAVGGRIVDDRQSSARLKGEW